ncbi:unnamed protein product [Prunus brigantina]
MNLLESPLSLSLSLMKHISLSPSTELAEIPIFITPFRTPSSPTSPSPLRRSVHRARRVRHLPRASDVLVLRLQKVDAHVNTIHELSVVMSIDFSKTVNEIHPS